MPTSSAPMWIQVERLCFSITCDKMLLSRARVSGTWGLKLLGKRSTSRRCWYFSCLRMNCAEGAVRGGFSPWAKGTGDEERDPGPPYLHVSKGLHQGNHLQLVELRQLLDLLDVLLAGRAGTGSPGDAGAELEGIPSSSSGTLPV